MEIEQVKSEYFQENTENKIFERSEQDPTQDIREINSSLGQIKLKSLKTGAILPNLQFFTTNVKNSSKKKKSSKHERKHEPHEEKSTFDFNDDWSKQSCNEFFVPVESFLKDVQLRREHSSKRRCKIVENLRNIENNRKYVEERIHEYDEKISLNVLLKNSKSCSLQVNQPMNVGQLNYRALIAQEILRKNSHCNRCTDRDRKYEDNSFLRSISFGLNSKSKKKNGILSFPSLVPKAATSHLFFSNNSYQQTLQQSNLQFQESSFRNFTDSSNEHTFKSSFNSLNNLLNTNANSYSSNRRPFMNKTPIEVQKNKITLR